MVAYRKHELSIQCWNVHGAFFNIEGNRYSKLHNDTEFIEHTRNDLIFGLIETHHKADDIPLLQIPEYRCFQVCRKKLKRGRKSGGICVYIHESIIRGVSKVNTAGSESIFIKLSKTFFSMEKDITVSFSYCVPAGSSYQTRTQFDPYDDLQEKVSSVAQSGDLICLGDFNARTASKPDYIVSDDNTDIPVIGDMCPSDTIATYPRGNIDTHTNSYGDRLLELCQSVPLRICNGRVLGDVLGSYTCYTENGQSTVDYCLVSPNIYHLISSFEVGEFLPNCSDHCSCSVTIRTNYAMDLNPLHNYSFVEKPRRVAWSPEISCQFENIIQNCASKDYLSEYEQQSVSDQVTVDGAVRSLSEFLVSAAVQAAGPALARAKSHVPRKSNKRNWKFRKNCAKFSKPKWFDSSCDTLKRQMRVTSRLLKQQPGNPYLKGKLMTESKEFKRLRKHKQKQFVNHMFTELDQLHLSNPKGYMDLVKSLRDGTFDKSVTDPTSHVSPDKWRDHFQGLLGPTVPQSPTEEELTEYIRLNCDALKSELDRPFTRTELLAVISGLPNNKAICFDRVSNEMLKAGKLVIWKQLLFIFNNILSSTLYPTEWRNSILSPLHKSDLLSDPNNFRGLAVGSCLGKLFNKLLHKRLENKCERENLIHECQGSGKKGSRTADHLMIVRFLIDKYVNHGKGRLFACFFDLKKAFDTVPRNFLFYTLLREYNIGGNFLKVLQAMYTQNNVFVKVSEGLCQPFVSTIGVLQGEVNSPLLFNLFVNKISEVFDHSCDPVRIGNSDQNCLLWADDLLVVSESAVGLQNSITRVSDFYSSLGLQLNIKKTKVMIFNKSGKVLKGYYFQLAGVPLEITESYQYLGVKIRPSGSFSFAADELCAKARKAWFAISNIIYKDKRMPVPRAFQLFDALVSPVALYACEFWFPLNLTKKSLKTKQNLLASWEGLKCETVNQQCSRILLSVHKKASRLAVLGDLGRYPMAIRAISQCLNYRLSLARKPNNSLLGLAMAEMRDFVGQGVDCWLGRVERMSDLLNMPKIYYSKSSGRRVTANLQSKFDRFWLDSITDAQIGSDGEQHNKLLCYSSFKCHFRTEPYVTLVRNRNQRCHLSRLRVSAHQLGVEVLRYRRPPVPRSERMCVYCPPGPGHPGARPLDDECHCVTECVVGQADRLDVYQSIGSRNLDFPNLSNINKFKFLVCPSNPTDCKTVSRYLQRQFDRRDQIDRGECIAP